MIRNSLICKLINVQASMKENKEKKIKDNREWERERFKKQLWKSLGIFGLISTEVRKGSQCQTILPSFPHKLGSQKSFKDIRNEREKL